MTKPIAIDSPPYRLASASLAFTRESFGQWLYLARRSSIPASPPTPRVQTSVSPPAATAHARPSTKGEPAIRYFD